MRESFTDRSGQLTLGALLTLAMGVSAFTQFALGVLAPFITEDLALSRTQFGTLTTALFVVGGLGSPVVGPVVDRLGGKRMMAVQLSIAALAWVGLATARSYWWLLAAAALAGIPRATSNLVGNQLILAHAPPGRRGILMGVNKAGAQIAAFLAGVALPAGALALGWRNVLAVSVSAALLGIVLGLRILPAGRSLRETPPQASVLPGTIRRVSLRLGPYAFFMGAGSAAVGTYLPLFAHEGVGLTVSRAGVVAAVIAVVSIGGRIVWAHLAEHSASKPMPLIPLAGASAAAMLLLMLAAEMGENGEVVLWLGALGYALSASAWISVGMLVIVREVQEEVAGRVTGVVLGAFYAGFASSPIAFGILVDRTSSYGPGWALVAGAFAAALVPAVLWHAESLRARQAQGASVAHRRP